MRRSDRTTPICSARTAKADRFWFAASASTPKAANSARKVRRDRVDGEEQLLGVWWLVAGVANSESV